MKSLNTALPPGAGNVAPSTLQTHMSIDQGIREVVMDMRKTAVERGDGGFTIGKFGLLFNLCIISLPYMCLFVNHLAISNRSELLHFIG